MLVVYFSKTNNVKRFINKTNCVNIEGSSELIVDEDFILLTYTTGFGEVPLDVLKFCEKNQKYIRGVISSGNKNWGELFGYAADLIADKYNVPILMKFELSGNSHDLEKFNKLVKKGK